jgi:hypothetical protein
LYRERSVSREAALIALRESELVWQIVYTSPSLAGVRAAALAVSRSRLFRRARLSWDFAFSAWRAACRFCRISSLRSSRGSGLTQRRQRSLRCLSRLVKPRSDRPPAEATFFKSDVRDRASPLFCRAGNSPYRDRFFARNRSISRNSLFFSLSLMIILVFQKTRNLSKASGRGADYREPQHARKTRIMLATARLQT